MLVSATVVSCSRLSCQLCTQTLTFLIHQTDIYSKLAGMIATVHQRHWSPSTLALYKWDYHCLSTAIHGIGQI